MRKRETEHKKSVFKTYQINENDTNHSKSTQNTVTIIIIPYY